MHDNIEEQTHQHNTGQDSAVIRNAGLKCTNPRQRGLMVLNIID